MFNNSMVASLSALILVATSAFALADSKDRPVSPQGAGVEIAPSDDALITPMKGTGLVSTEELAMRGAKAAAPANFPATSLDTVARGKVGAVESVINWDSRTRGYTVDYPNRAIVFIEYNGDHLCTGYMYAPNMVATAGHCVHTGGSSGAWRTKSLYKVYAGRDGTASPYGFCTVARLNSVLGWTRDGDFHYDYAAMRLNCTIGNTVGWFGMYTPSGGMNQPAIIAGYPGDKPRTLWTSADKIRAVSTTMIAYRMDTVGGHSGSPIWHDRDEALASDGAWAIGVHNYGVGAFGTNANSAARLTSSRIANYAKWRDAP